MISEFQRFLLSSPHLLGFLPLVVSSYFLGRAVVPRSLFATSVESTAVRLSIGFVALALLGFALGLAGLLQPVPALGSLALLSLMAIWLRRDGRSALSSREAFGSSRWILLGALTYFGVQLVRLALFPPTDWDAVSYHLPVARDFLDRGLAVASPHLRFPVFPQAANLLFGWGLLTGGVAASTTAAATAAELFSLASWGLIGVLLFAWAGREISPRTGLWAACLWMGGQTALRCATTAYVDVVLSLFVFASGYLLWRWHSTPNSRTRQTLLVLAAVLAGAGAGTKYSGGWLTLLFSIGVALWELRGRKLRSTLVFLGVASLVASPWYLRNAWLGGDPFFPMLGPWLGLRFWSLEDLARQRTELLSHGVGHDLWGAVRVWWDLAWNQSRFHGERVASLALVLPLPILAWWRWRDPRGRAVVLLVFGAILPWFFTGQVLRYLLPVLPFLCLEVSALLERAASALHLPSKRAWGVLASSFVALLLMWPGFDHLAATAARRGRLPVTEVERAAYVGRELAGADAVHYLNASHGREYGLYVLYESRLAFACEGRFSGDWFGPARYDDLVSRIHAPDSLARWLGDLGATHLLIVRAKPHPHFPVWEGSALPGEPAYEACFETLVSSAEYSLYAIRPVTASLDASAGEPR